MQTQTVYLIQSHFRGAQEICCHPGQPRGGDQFPDCTAVAVQVEHLEEAQLVGGMLGQHGERLLYTGHRTSVNPRAQDRNLRDSSFSEGRTGKTSLNVILLKSHRASPCGVATTSTLKSWETLSQVCPGPYPVPVCIKLLLPCSSPDLFSTLLHRLFRHKLAYQDVP